MPSILPKYEHGPIGFTVAEHVEGGQFVEARSAGLVGVAAAGSLVAIGVAQARAYEAGDAAIVTATTTLFGAPLVQTGVPTTSVSVFVNGVVPVTFSANANFGVKLKVGAAGGVTPWITGTDDQQAIVGICFTPGGVASGAVGLVKLR